MSCAAPSSGLVELDRDKQVEITPDFVTEADERISHYPASKRSAVLPLLYLWQEEHGYITNQAVHWVAEKLELQPINVLEVVTFYPMFKTHAVGKFHITVCRTLPCALAGSYDVRDHLMEQAGIKELDHHGFGISDDGKFSIEFIECLAQCGSAPIVMVNDNTYEWVDQDKGAKIVQKYKDGKGPADEPVSMYPNPLI